MALDPQLRGQLRETINVAPATMANASGDLSYRVAVAQAARVVWIDGTTEGGDGTSETSAAVLITETEILETSLIFLPGVDPRDLTLGRLAKRIERGVGELGSVNFWRVTV